MKSIIKLILFAGMANAGKANNAAKAEAAQREASVIAKEESMAVKQAQKQEAAAAEKAEIKAAQKKASKGEALTAKEQKLLNEQSSNGSRGEPSPSEKGSSSSSSSASRRAVEEESAVKEAAVEEAAKVAEESYGIAESQVKKDAQNGNRISEEKVEGGVKVIEEGEGGLKVIEEGEGGLKVKEEGEGGLKVKEEGEGGVKVKEEGEGGVKVIEEGEGGLKVKEEGEGGLKVKENNGLNLSKEDLRQQERLNFPDNYAFDKELMELRVDEIQSYKAFEDMPNEIALDMAEKNISVDMIQKNEVLSLKGKPKEHFYSYTDHKGRPVVMDMDMKGTVTALEKTSYSEIFKLKNYKKGNFKEGQNPLLRMGKNSKMPRTVKGKVVGKKWNRTGRVNRRGVPKMNASKLSSGFDRALGIIGAVAMLPMVLITPTMLGYYGEFGHFGGSWVNSWDEWFNAGDFKTKELCDGCEIKVWDLDGGALATEKDFKDICGNYIDTLEWSLIAPVDRDTIEANEYMGAPCVSQWIPLMDGTSDWRPDEFRGCPLAVGPFYEYEYSIKYEWDNFLTGTQTDIWFFKDAYGNQVDCHGNTVSDWQFQGLETLFQGGFGLSKASTLVCTNNSAEGICEQVWRWPASCQENNNSLEFPRGYPMDTMKKCYNPMNEYQFWKQWVVNGGWSHCNDDPKKCGGQRFTNFGGLIWDVAGSLPQFYVEAFNEAMLFEEELQWLTTDGSLPKADYSGDGQLVTNLKRPPLEILEATFGVDNTKVHELSNHSIVIEEWWCNAQKILSKNIGDSDSNQLDLIGVHTGWNAYQTNSMGADILEVENHIVYNRHTEAEDLCTPEYWIDFYKARQDELLEANDLPTIYDLRAPVDVVDAYDDMEDCIDYMRTEAFNQSPRLKLTVFFRALKDFIEDKLDSHLGFLPSGPGLESAKEPAGLPGRRTTTTEAPSDGRRTTSGIGRRTTTTKEPSGGRPQRGY